MQEIAYIKVKADGEYYETRKGRRCDENAPLILGGNKDLIAKYGERVIRFYSRNHVAIAEIASGMGKDDWLYLYENDRGNLVITDIRKYEIVDSEEGKLRKLELS